MQEKKTGERQHEICTFHYLVSCTHYKFKNWFFLSLLHVWESFSFNIEMAKCFLNVNECYKVA